MKKCIVKGCKNHRHDGLFVGDLCNPCHVMLTEGRRMPSEAWFVAEPGDWLPMTMAPLDGTAVDLWTVRGQRITNVRFIRGVDVDPKYAPGGEWAHRAPEDGWRTYEHKEAWLVPEQFTHFRYITGPNGQHPQG